MQTVIMDHIMDTQFEVRYKEVAEFNWSYIILLGELPIVSIVWLQLGSRVHWQYCQVNKVINTPQLSMSFATMEGKIVDIIVGLNQVMR